jgi:hypothetical protein
MFCLFKYLEKKHLSRMSLLNVKFYKNNWQYAVLSKSKGPSSWTA